MMSRRAPFLVLLLTSIVSLATSSGCGSGDQPLEAVDPNAAPADPDYTLVFNIIHNECTPCHGGGGGNVADAGVRSRDDIPLLGAGVAPPLETCDEIYVWRRNIEQVIENNTMPPGAWPRLSEVDKLIVKRWLENGAKVPCR